MCAQSEAFAYGYERFVQRRDMSDAIIEILDRFDAQEYCVERAVKGARQAQVDYFYLTEEGYLDD